jgi:DnaJ-class molecular chaperone
MKTPYDILEVAEQATDSEIKQAYLQKVKQFPPDHYHEQFQQVHQAYETIKNLKCRTQYTLFTLPDADFNRLLDAVFIFEPVVSINADQFNKLLGASVDDKTLKIATHEMMKII